MNQLVRPRYHDPRDKKVWELPILKARKYLCISPSSIPLLTSKKCKNLNTKTTKRLLSKYLKKNPFQSVSLRPDSPKITIATRFAREYIALESDSDNSDDFFLRLPSLRLKSHLRLFERISSTYKSLESLDLSLIKVQHKSLFDPLKKLNQLQKLRLKLSAENSHLYLGFF